MMGNLSGYQISTQLHRDYPESDFGKDLRHER